MWGKYSKNLSDETIGDNARGNCVVNLNPGMIDDNDNNDDDDGGGNFLINIISKQFTFMYPNYMLGNFLNVCIIEWALTSGDPMNE